jgi:hypothetical protein
VGTTFYLSLPEAEARIAQQAVGTQAPLEVASVQAIRDARPGLEDRDRKSGSGGGAAHAADAQPGITAP